MTLETQMRQRKTPGRYPGVSICSALLIGGYVPAAKLPPAIVHTKQDSCLGRFGADRVDNAAGAGHAARG